ncbi:hypothetical protein LXL04_036651 [Taraxacum kok-saghyz]
MNSTTLRRRLSQTKLLFPFLLPVTFPVAIFHFHSLFYSSCGRFLCPMGDFFLSEPQNRLNQQAKPVAQSSHKLKNFQIYRWNPEIPAKPDLKNYEIDLKECGSMVFDALIKIKNEIDPTEWITIGFLKGSKI